MKKALSLLLAALMLLSVLTACGPQSGSESTDPPADKTDAAQPTEDGGDNDDSQNNENTPLEGEITFWHSFTQGPRLETIQAAADSFMKDNPGVKINIETFSWADFYTKWTTGLASGNVPDMSTAQIGQAVEMMNAGAIRPMDGLIDRMGRDRFYEAPLAEMTYEDGKCYGIPIYSHAFVMWYRKDLLEKYNLEVPATWDEMMECATTITEGEGGDVYGCSVPMGNNDQYCTYFMDIYMGSRGASLLTEDRKANLTSPEALEGIQYWVDMYKKNSPAESINFNTLDQATLSYQGKNAFDFNSAFHIGGVEANSPDLMDYIDCAPVPTKNEGEEPEYIVHNTPLVIWQASEHPEICEAFIEYLYTPEIYVPFLHSVPVGMLPALKEITDDPAFLDNEYMQKYSHCLEVISNAVNHGTFLGMENGPCVESGIIANSRVIENMFQDIVLNGTDIETAAKNAEDQLNTMFEAAS